MDYQRKSYKKFVDTATTAVIKVTNKLTTEDIAKGITVKLADSKKVLDTKSNLWQAFFVCIQLVNVNME